MCSQLATPATSPGALQVDKVDGSQAETSLTQCFKCLSKNTQKMREAARVIMRGMDVMDPRIVAERQAERPASCLCFASPPSATCWLDGRRETGDGRRFLGC